MFCFIYFLKNWLYQYGYTDLWTLLRFHWFDSKASLCDYYIHAYEIPPIPLKEPKMSPGSGNWSFCTWLAAKSRKVDPFSHHLISVAMEALFTFCHSMRLGGFYLRCPYSFWRGEDCTFCLGYAFCILLSSPMCPLPVTLLPLAHLFIFSAFCPIF